MITQEEIKVNGRTFTKTYSDLYYIKQIETGREYQVAVDILNKYRYIETAKPLPVKVSKEENVESTVNHQENIQEETVI